VGAFVSLGISNALRPLSDVDRGAYYALAAVALFLSTMILSYLEKVHDTHGTTHAVTPITNLSDLCYSHRYGISSLCWSTQSWSWYGHDASSLVVFPTIPLF
jgi:hypothetical protein